MKFREMRRNKQLMTQQQCTEILQRNTAGVLSVYGDGGYPYGVPLSYVYSDGKIFFHCAKEGHKLDAIQNCDKVSFCVIDEDRIVPQEYTSYFRSVIVFGRARIITDEREKLEALRLLAMRYAPDDGEQNRRQVINDGLDRLYMVEISAEHISGKQARELI